MHYKGGGSGYTIKRWEWVHYKGGGSGCTIKGVEVVTL